MKIYIDSECKCHTVNTDNAFREFDVPFFDGKCQTFIEGYRYCPAGESYSREDGEVFHGECVVPWKDYSELDAAQREYERQQLVEYEKALAEIEAALGV
jgi:hypothetical protein